MSRAPFAVVSCLLVALLATGWWLLQRPAEVVPGASAGGLPTAPAPAPVPAAPDGTPPGAAANAPERTVAEAAAAPRSGANAVPMRRLAGTIVVAEPNGPQHASSNGVVELQFEMPPEAEREYPLVVMAAVHAGHWKVDVAPDATRLKVGTIDLDGRPATCREEFDLATSPAPLQLHAFWRPTLRLRVIGADTRTDLADLQVVRVHYWVLDEFRHPGNYQTQILLEHGRSPLQLPPVADGASARFWIKAPGYAWDQIQLATEEPGERTLRLVPGGDVDVTLVGNMPDGAVLRVRASPDEGTAPSGLLRHQELPMGEFAVAKAGATRLDGLPAGTWALSLEKGRWFRAQVVFGVTTVAVAAGAIVPATITVRADAQPPVATMMRGTLVLSPKWGEDIHLELEPAGDTKAWTKDRVTLRLDGMQAEGPGRYRWGEVALLAGRWEITVRGTEHRAVLEVGPGHPDQVDIVVPDPNEVRVRVVDAATGRPIPGAAPSWYGTVEGWSSGWSHGDMEAIGDDWYRCLAGAGTIVVSVHPDGYLWSLAQYEVHPGPNELVVRVARVCGVELTLKDGDVTIPWPDNAFATIEHTTTKAGAAYWSGSKIAANEPGEHLLTMQPIAGYEPIPPRKVQIEPERWTAVEIVLQPKR